MRCCVKTLKYFDRDCFHVFIYFFGSAVPVYSVCTAYIFHVLHFVGMFFRGISLSAYAMTYHDSFSTIIVPRAFWCLGSALSSIVVHTAPMSCSWLAKACVPYFFKTYHEDNRFSPVGWDNSECAK